MISENNDSKHKYVIATCCNPIPGDKVIGFLATDGTVTVHKSSCANANSIASKFGDRIVVPKWEHAKTQNLSFLVRLSLKGFDRIGMINDITRYISFVMSVNIRKFCLGTEDGVYTLTDLTSDVESYWVTPKDKFKHPHKLKTTNKRGCVVEAIGDVTGQMADYYINRKDYVKARQYIKPLLLRNDSISSNAWYTMAVIIDMRTGEHDSALYYCNKLLEIIYSGNFKHYQNIINKYVEKN